MAKNGPKNPNLSVVPDPRLDPLTAGFLGAVRRESEYETGSRIVDQGWIDKLLTDPERGEMLEGWLRDTVGVGRRAPEQLADVEAETRAIIASLTDPTVALTDELINYRDRFLRALDIMNPATHEDIKE